MRRATPEPKVARTASAHLLLRWGGLGAVLAGVLFLVWGYIDRPGISGYGRVAVDVLSFVVPAFFLVGLLGLYAQCERQEGRVGKMGFVLGFTGAALGAVGGLLRIAPLLRIVPWYVYPLAGWFSLWLPILLAGLTWAGLSALRRRTLRGAGALPLAMGVVGWAYYFTDSGAPFEARLVHVGFGLLFSLGWIALGLALRVAGVQQTKTTHP